jgi:hypothetical protein
MSRSEIESIAKEEEHSMPLLSAKWWSITFLCFGVVLAVVFSITMPAFIENAH